MEKEVNDSCETDALGGLGQSIIPVYVTASREVSVQLSLLWLYPVSIYL